MFKVRNTMKNAIFLLVLTIVFTFTAVSALTSNPVTVNAAASLTYTVRSGDTLWLIASRNGLTVSQLKQYNGLTGDMIYPGQFFRLVPCVKYTVKSGDTLWLISRNHNTSVAAIKTVNRLSSDTIYVSQVLYVPGTGSSGTGVTRPTPVTSWPSVTHIVQAGDYVSVVAAKFGVPQGNILKYNYMGPDDWLNVGQKIAINGYAPRNYAVVPGESSAPAKSGTLTDWFLDGQYLLRRNGIFQITDYYTGATFKVRMLGGVNHSDVETLTANDTAVMQRLFPTWNWTPRPVVIFFNGMNIAASISGMPHADDTIPGNNVSGHFDMYLYNSKSHSSTTSQTYVQQHQTNCLIAAGRK